MKEYSADKIRNIALVGHSGAGKTQLTEAFLYLTKVTTRMGRPEEGNTVSDFDAEEHRRGISISSSVIPVEYEGHKLNFLDTPGYADLVGNVKSALTAAETALLVVDAVAGVEVGTELAWQMADELGLAKAVVLNKMDRDNANWKAVLGQLRESFPDARFVPLQVPIGQSATFNGVYRLISKTASMGAEGKAGDAPPDVLAEADDLREQLVEAAAEGDDALIMKFLDGETLTPDEIRHGLQEGAKAGKYVPVYFAAADSGPIRSSSPWFAFQSLESAVSVPETTRRYCSLPTYGSAIVLNTRTASGPDPSAVSSTGLPARSAATGRASTGDGAAVMI